LLLAFFTLSLSHPLTHERSTRQVYDFPSNTSWLENLAVRCNGQVLATRLDVPQLYQIDPTAQQPKPELIYTFPEALGAFGIVELPGQTDVFAVGVGNFSLATVTSTPGTYSIWRVDMRPISPAVSKYADIPPASFINGMVSLAAEQHALLVSDSTLGNVWRFDLQTGVYTVAIEDALMKKVSPAVGEGINGIKLFGRYLYFVNSYGPFLARVPIHANGTKAGKGEIVAYSLDKRSFDDFAIDDDGTAYVATGTGNSVTMITPDGKVKVIAGSLNSTEIASPTSVALGRAPEDRRTLYVTTGGGLEGPINGTVILGAQLVAVDLT